MKTGVLAVAPAIFCSVALALLAGVTEQAPNSSSLRFVAFGAGLPTSGQWREGFRIADMNGDGHPDIVLTTQRKKPGSPPTIFLGDGKGSWARWTDAHFPPLAYDYGDVEVADFNRDGHMDLALGVHFHGILALLGDGKGNFSNASSGLEFSADKAGSVFSSRALRAADWNGDSLPDLVAVSEGPQSAIGVHRRNDGVAIYLNQGVHDGTLSWRRLDLTLSPGNFSDSIALGDFNGDHHTDVASGSSNVGRKDLINLWRADGKPGPVLVDIPYTYHYVRAVASGDFDHDGRAGLLVAYDLLDKDVWYSAADLYLLRPDGKWERRAIAKEQTRVGLVAIASGHFRNRTTRDVVALTALGETIFFLADGHGGFTTKTHLIPNYPGNCRGSHIEVADLDGDGIDEIVTSFADEPGEEGCPTGGGVTVWKAVSGP